MNKKGSLLDPIFGTAYVLKIAITILITLFIWGSFQLVMTESVSGKSYEGIITDAMDLLETSYYSIDYLFPFIIGGLLIISTYTAWKSGANVALGVLSFLLWAIALFLAALFVNIYLNVSDGFVSIYPNMPIMDIIMSNMHWFTLAWLAIITLVMFRKNNQEDDADTSNLRRFYGQ